MEVMELARKAYVKGDLINFLRGEGDYLVEPSQFSPMAGVPDVGRVLSKGIYKLYGYESEVKKEFEKALYHMLDGDNYDVYLVCLYIMSQLFKEKNSLAPFHLDVLVIDKLALELRKRKQSIMHGIVYPSGYMNSNAWSEFERFDKLAREEYGIRIIA